jgi:hypothetical protein
MKIILKVLSSLREGKCHGLFFESEESPEAEK